jgi:hypothetical protein
MRRLGSSSSELPDRYLSCMFGRSQHPTPNPQHPSLWCASRFEEREDVDGDAEAAAHWVDIYRPGGKAVARCRIAAAAALR